MEFFTMDFLWSLLAIVFIDLVLAGDNAIIIGMAARRLPMEQQRKAIFWGTAGAIGIRFLSSVAVVWLLKLPALMIVGGFLLVWIAHKLLTDKKEHEINAHSDLWTAVKTIVIADGVMGIDNVMAVAGVAHGDLLLVTIGILITIPVIIWGSTAFIKLVDRFPAVIYLGGAVLTWTAGGMIAGDPLTKEYFSAIPYAKWLVSGILTVVVLAVARFQVSPPQDKNNPSMMEG